MEFYTNVTTMLGPLLTCFCNKLSHSLVGKEAVYMLAREGYWLGRAYEISRKYGQIRGVALPESSYLLVSRAFLYRLGICDERFWRYSLSADFNGSFLQLMNSRFGLSYVDVESIFSTTDSNTSIVLENDRSMVQDMLWRHRNALTDLITPSEQAYLSYLSDLGLVAGVGTANYQFVDVGYSGSIQKMLSLLLNASSSGHYAIASSPGVQDLDGINVSMIGHLFEGVKMGDGNVMLDRSMFLEALLTSQEGQFKDICFSRHPDRRYDFYFGRQVNSQKYFNDLSWVVDDALTYLKHSLQGGIEFSTEEVEVLYRQYVTRPNMIPRSIRHLFSIDDDVTDNGTVSPLSFFGL